MGKYRLGKRQKRAILEVATGHEYLVFPRSKTEHVAEFLEWLNGREVIHANDPAAGDGYDDAMKIVEENFKHLNELIKNESLTAFYKGVIAECMVQFRRDSPPTRSQDTPTDEDKPFICSMSRDYGEMKCKYQCKECKQKWRY